MEFHQALELLEQAPGEWALWWLGSSGASMIGEIHGGYQATYTRSPWASIALGEYMGEHVVYADTMEEVVIRLAEVVGLE